MKIALFDDINEAHVSTALASALRAAGHEVHWSGKLWHGHGIPTQRADIERIDVGITSAIDAGSDALFNFRAGALTSQHMRRLQEAEVVTAVWLPDDPVLYATTYRHVVDEYDHVLHCGPGNILDFYCSKGHAPGVTFPFWVDPECWARSWSPESVEADFVFLGNLHGPAKRDRYSMLAAAAGRVSIYGNCPLDPVGIHRGSLYGVEAIRAILSRYAAGLNIAQRFSDYAGTAFDFPELSQLGHFDLPSRVLQYAAVGLPVVTLGGPAGGSAHFTSVLQATDMHEASGLVGRLRSDVAFAHRLSDQGRSEVEAHFSAGARARFLVEVLSGNIRSDEMDATAREFAYRNYERGRS